MPGTTTIIDWLGYGDAADIPDPAALDALIAPGTFALYFAGDTGDVSALDRAGPSWTVIATSGATGITQLTGDGTAGPGSGSQAFTLTNDAVTTAKIIDDAITTDKIIDGAVTNAKLADMPAHSFKGNNTGSTDVPLDLTAEEVADEISPFISLGTILGGTEGDPVIIDVGGLTLATGTRSGDATEYATSDGSLTEGNAVTVDADGNLTDAGPLATGEFTAVTKTADYTVLSGDSGTDFNNDGAVGDIILSLPAAVPDMVFGAAIHAAFYIKLLANGTDKIAIGTDNSAAGGYVRSNAAFSYIEIRCHVAGQLVASTMSGTWSIDA